MIEITNNLNSKEYQNREIIKNTNELRKCKKCNNLFPYFIKLENGKKIDCRHRIYCLECSPFGKRKMSGPDPKYYQKGSTEGRRLLIKIDRICNKCGKIFHQATRNNTCTTCRNKKQRNENKINAVQLKGGKCIICGYNKCLDAFNFHHINPEEKLFTLSGSWHLSKENINKEIEKCVLLCANCHAEVHNGMTLL